MSKSKSRRVLVIGDLHTPFELKGYLDFCKRAYKKYDCTHVVFIGDIVDGHASSYHESNPDGTSAGDELREAQKRLSHWYKTFPDADIIIGNHDRIVARKALTAGISKHWIRSFNEVLGVPKWKFHHKLILDGVLYIHGEGVTAKTKSLRAGRSVVQGHRHTEAYVWYQSLGDHQLFGMQVGTGIDSDSYAFEYAKDHPPAVLSCGIVLENGTEAHIIPYS